MPDKDADGLSAGVIIHRTLTNLGLNPSCLDVHLVSKGSNIHEQAEREDMLAKKPKYVIVVDQGSRNGPPIIDSDDTQCLIIDHHYSDEFPQASKVSQILSGKTMLTSQGRVWLPLPSSSNIGVNHL